MIRRYFTSILVGLLVLFAFSAAALAKTADNPEVRVLLKSSSSASSYTITVKQGVYDILMQQDESYVSTIYAGDSYTFNINDGQMAVPAEDDSLFQFDGTSYRGSFKTMSNGSYNYAINQLDVEHYLYGVVGRELGYNYHIESTKAQAVSARSYAIGNISSKNKYYDLTTTTSSQVYGGYDAETAHIRKAVDATSGMVLLYEGAVVPAFFSSSAGGHSEDIEKVWVSDDVPIVGVPSPYDAQSANYSTYGASCWSWVVEYTPAELVALANKYGKTDIGEYLGITMSTTDNGQTSVSGRAMIVTIKGTNGSVSATKDNIRGLLNLKSTLITITDNTADPIAAYVLGKEGAEKLTPWQSLIELFAQSASSISKMNGDNENLYVISRDGVTTIDKSTPLVEKVVISGRGYGHGVGMSQWGAIAMGDNGYSWQEIIEHYYCSGGIELVNYY